MEISVTGRRDLVETIVGDGFYGRVFVVDVHVEGCEQSEWIAVFTVSLDGRADARLREDQVCELVSIKDLCVPLEQLLEKSVDGQEIDGRVWAEKIKVYVYKRLLVAQSENVEQNDDHLRCPSRRQSRRHFLFVFVSWWGER